ncbi:MAG: extracellular solute-binding protein [Brevinematia bacterium]
MKQIIFTLTILVLSITSFAQVKINIWHAYRGDEKKAIEQVADTFNITYFDTQITLLPVPFDAMNDKLRTMIPLGKGPDLFIFAQDFTGEWANNNIIVPISSMVNQSLIEQFPKYLLQAYVYGDNDDLWALPMSFKNLILFYNKNYVSKVPNTWSELIDLAKKFTDPKSGPYGRRGFVYDMGNFYYHTMWIQGFGGRIFKKVKGTEYFPLLDSEPVYNSIKYVLRLKKMINPTGDPKGEVGGDNATVTELFNSGNALFVVNGQWFRAEISPKVNYGVAPFPIIDDLPGIKGSGRRAIPFLTVEGIFMSSNVKNKQAAFKVMEFITSPQAGRIFAKVGKQTPANINTYKYSEVKNDPISQIFIEAAKEAIPMPNVPEMALTWSPATSALVEATGLDADDPQLDSKIKSIWKKRQDELINLINTSLRKK